MTHPITRRYLLALVGVVLLALALRAWFWSWQAQSGAVQPGDPEEYYRAALHLLNGGYHDNGKWLRPPLYPAFLAAMFAIGGVNLPFALLGQALLSGLGVLAFVFLGTQLFGRRDVGLLSGLIAALFVPLASFGSVLFAESLFVILAVLGLALFERTRVSRDWRWALACGLVFGLAALTRAVAVYFIPLGVLLLLLARSADRRPETEDRRPEVTHQGREGREGLESRSTQYAVRRVLGSGFWVLGSVLFLLGATLVIAPWTVRNALVHQRFILVDTNGGISMWYGTTRSNEDERQGEARIFSLPNLADRQALAVQMGLENIRNDPAWFFGRVRFKLASLFLLQSRSYAVGDVLTIDTQNRQIALSAGENPFSLSVIADGQYMLIMLGAIVGLAFAPSWRRVLPVLAWIAVLAGLSAITVAHHRLRLPIVGVLIPFAAFALLMPFHRRARKDGQLIREEREETETPSRAWRPWRLIIALLGCFTFLALVFSFRYVTWARAELAALPGRVYMMNGEPGRAQEPFAAALALDPNNALRVADLADAHFYRGDAERALELYQQSARLEERSLYAHAMTAYAANLLQRPAEAHAALEAIRGYGRDNNDLYTWAWDVMGLTPPRRVVPGDPVAFGHYVGFAPATFDLPEGRWTLGDARLRITGGCGVARLRLRGPAGRSVTVGLEQARFSQVLTTDGTVQEVILPLNTIFQCDEGLPVRIAIRSATSLLDLERAPWMVGVAVLSVEYEW
ncbi:MAG: glycosyltransferase family 39 protein [Chloroflexaceae bacterium]|nr:glycosyltransferase family 39 protein [Chloroflexaceae bacterium]